MSSVHDGDYPFRILGLARRAGAVITGLEAIRSRGRREPIYLLLAADDTGPTTWKRLETFANRQDVPLYRFGNREEWQVKLGCSGAVLALTGRSFADTLIKWMEQEARKEIK